MLLAFCDANYCFTFVDIGDYGSTNDASVQSNSAFEEAFDKESRNTEDTETIQLQKCSEASICAYWR